MSSRYSARRTRGSHRLAGGKSEINSSDAPDLQNGHAVPKKTRRFMARNEDSAMKLTEIESTGSQIHDDASNGHVAERKGISGCLGWSESGEQAVVDSDLHDPYCDPSNPVTVSVGSVSRAAFLIRDGIVRSACTRSRKLSEVTGVQIFFKREIQQMTGSFKERGARNVLLQLTEEQKRLGVVAASAGNHAQALAYHGQLLNIPVVVFMPVNAPIMKVSACRDYGADIRQVGADIGESKVHALRLAKQTGMMYINGYDHPEIIAGQGTMGFEIMEQMSQVDAVVIPHGGGGLLAGTAVAVKHLNPDVKVIAVESERARSLSRSVERGSPTKFSVGSTLSDGLAVPLMGCNAFATAKGLIDKIVAVDEAHIALAILRLVEMEKAVVEGAGAVGLAAILQGLLPELAGKRVCIALTGGNIDTTVLGRCLERGLATDGRLGRLIVTVSDRPGGISQLTRRIAETGASIKDILHERAWLMTDIFSVRVRATIETRDKEHYSSVVQELRQFYDDVKADAPF